MAQYTIVTNREQEAGLTYAHEHYAEEGQTKEQFLQSRVNHSVLNSMFVEYKNAQSVSLEKSIITIPAANEAKAAIELQAVIVANGGTLVPIGPPPDPILDAIARANGTLPALGRTVSNTVQARTANQAPPLANRPDGAGDNASEK